MCAVDVQQAGEGELQIMVNHGNTPNHVEQKGVGVYSIKFTPETAGKQDVDIRFNNEPLLRESTGYG